MKNLDKIRAVLQLQLDIYHKNWKRYNEEKNLESIKEALQQVGSLEEFIDLNLKKTSSNMSFLRPLSLVFEKRFIELFNQNPIREYESLMVIYNKLFNYECKEYVGSLLIKKTLTELETLTWEEKISRYNFVVKNETWQNSNNEWLKIVQAMLSSINKLEDLDVLIRIAELEPYYFSGGMCMGIRANFIKEISSRIIFLTKRNTLQQNVDFARKITKNKLFMKNLGEEKVILFDGIKNQIVAEFSKIVVERSVSFEHLYSYLQEVLIDLKPKNPNGLSENFNWDHYKAFEMITKGVVKLFEEPLLKYTCLMAYKVDFKLLFDMYQLMRTNNLLLYHAIGKQLSILSKTKENEELLNKLSSKYLFKIEFDENKISQDMFATS